MTTLNRIYSALTHGDGWRFAAGVFVGWFVLTVLGIIL